VPKAKAKGDGPDLEPKSIGEPPALGLKEQSGNGALLPPAATEDEDTEKSRGIGLTYVAEEDKDSINLSPSQQVKDEIRYVVETSKEGIKVSIDYKQEVEVEDSKNKTETEFQLEFESIIEYVKGQQTQRWGFSNGVSTEAYDWSTDEIIQVIPLKNWDHIPGIISDPDGVVSYFTATAALVSPSMAVGPTGKMHFNFTVSEANIDEHITANSMKIDVQILDFPWQRSNSYVALMSSVDSKKKVQMEYNNEAFVSGGKSKLTQEVFVAFDQQSLGLEAFGEYRWENNAVATTADESLVDDGDVITERGGSRRALFFEDNSDGEVSGNDVVQNEDTLKDENMEEGTGEVVPNDVIVDAVVEDVSARPASTGESAPEQPATHTTDSTVIIQVVATSPEETTTDNHQEIAYSFVGAHSAKEIYWDPQAGIGYGEAPVSTAWASRGFGLATTMLSALPYMAL
jgi:hypothetical protein